MSKTVRADEAHLKRVAALAEEIVHSGEYASAVLAVANLDGVVWRHVVPGEDDLGWDTVFWIASINKPIVATALMQLVERGLVVLGEPVAQHLPEFARHGKEALIVWHLLTKTCGYAWPPESLFDELIQTRAPLSAHLEVAYDLKLAHEPGAQASDTDLNYIVLAELIRRVTGKPYSEYLHEQLFTPLGMQETSFAPGPERRAPRHDIGPGELPHFISLALPFAGLFSTADDLVALGRAFLNNGKLGAVRVLSQAAITTMTQPVMLKDARGDVTRPTYAGLGWGLRGPHANVLGSPRAYGHAGASGSWLWIDPEWELVFVLLSNTAHGKPTIPMRLLNAVYGALER